MTDTNDRAVIGDNSIAELKDRIDGLVSAGNAWAKTDVSDEEQASLLAAFKTQIVAAEREVGAAEEAEKRPLLDATNAVREKYKPLTALLAATKKVAVDKLTAYGNKLEAARREKQRLADEAAAKAQREADEATAKAAQEAHAGGNVVQASVEAELAQKRAADALKAADAAAAPVAIKSDHGGRTVAMRTVKTAQIESYAMALNFYKNHVEIKALVQTLATRDIRAGKEVPGVKMLEDKVAA